MPSTLEAVPTTVRCTRCGAEFPAQTEKCPSCGRVATSHSTRLTIIITLLLIFAGLGFTQYFVNLHRATEYSLAHRWSFRGGEAMQAHLPSVAADDYRTALSYDPENREYRLLLAQALLAGNRLNEARAHLTSLWEQEPANGEVNLTLARLYAKRGDFHNATRFYNNAINGIWKDDPRKDRIAVRFELADYLMQQHNMTQAQSELMALLADGPSDRDDQLRLAQMLLEANEPERVVQVDNEVLSNDHGNAEAWLQKGQALVTLGRYKDAERALATAEQHNPKVGDVAGQLELVREVLRVDPSLRGLSRSERAERAVNAFHTAWEHLNSCATQAGMKLNTGSAAIPVVTPGTSPKSLPTPTMPATSPDPVQLLYSSGLAKHETVTEQALRDNPDAIDSTMQYVFEVERVLAPVCPNMSVNDQALLMLGQHESETLK